MSGTTVVIPTLMKAPVHLQRNMEMLCRQDCDIILIDNSTANLAKKFENMSSRIRIIYFPSNIGVNRAWNLGVAAAETEYYLILNDDCLVWSRCIARSESILVDRKIGLLTYRTMTETRPEIHYSLFMNQYEKPDLVSMGPSHAQHTAGWFMYGRVAEYEPIPAELRIFYGDNFIYQTLRKKGLRTVIDRANILYHEVSVTINSAFTAQQVAALFINEGTLYRQVEEKYGIGGH